MTPEQIDQIRADLNVLRELLPFSQHISDASLTQLMLIHEIRELKAEITRLGRAGVS
jgi:hypothetical protein